MPKDDIEKRIDAYRDSNGAFYWDNVLDPSLTKTPAVPSGWLATAVVDGILITIDMDTDTSHSSIANFESYIVYARPASDTTTTGEEVGRIPYGMNSWVWQQEFGGYTGWDISLTGVSSTGYESAKADWQRCVVSTFHDDFAGYGNEDKTQDIASLYWLQIAKFGQYELDNNWWLMPGGGGTIALNSTAGQFVEGDGGYRWTDASSSILISYGAWALASAYRFPSDAYVVVSYYVHSASASYIRLSFLQDGAAGWAYYDITDLAAGMHHLFVKRSDFTEIDSPDWTQDFKIEFSTDDAIDVTLDDLRLVRACPSDPDIFSDIGDSWTFSDGTWHVYPGNRTSEPALPFTLGQIENAADDWYFAYAANVNVVNGRISAPIYLKGADGRAGVLFRVADATAGSEDSMAIVADSAADMIYLVQWEAGGDAATTNMVLNPSAEAAGNFAAEGSATVTADTTYAYRGAKAYKVVNTAAADDGMNLTLSALTNADHYVSYWVYDGVPTDYTYDPFPTANVSLDGSTWHTPEVLETKQDWVRYGVLIDDAEANGSTTLYIEQTDATARTLYIDGVQVEAAAAATAYCDGAQGLGYSWSGTAHQSTSARQAGSPFTHASASYTFAPDTLYWVGADFRDPDHEYRINVYAGATEGDLFTASGLVISQATTLEWPEGGGVGATCYAANCRIGDFRAGSPQTADYAHRAGVAEVAKVAVTISATEPATMWAAMLWYDSANDLLKLRKLDNSGWYTFTPT